MQLTNALPSIEDVYTDKDFIEILESHLTYLRQHPDNIFLDVTEHQAYKYEGDFYGLLKELNIPYFMHYIVLRINGYGSSADYAGQNYKVVKPKESVIQLLASVYRTSSF